MVQRHSYAPRLGVVEAVVVTQGVGLVGLGVREAPRGTLPPLVTLHEGRGLGGFGSHAGGSSLAMEWEM